MLYQSQSKQLIEILNSRNIKIYHACQLSDFKSYLKLDGVPSRQLLSQSRLPFTAFDTDGVDSKNDVWDKVFGNFSDFGYGFYHNNFGEKTAPTPNPYGPILLVFKPNVLQICQDISITLRSAGAGDFNRKNESISELADISKLFYFENIDFSDSDFKKSRIASESLLNERFNVRFAKNPELNCKTNNGIFPWFFLDFIICDPLQLDNINLKEIVEILVQNYSLKTKVFERSRAINDRVEMINEIVSFCIKVQFSLDTKSLRKSLVSNDLKKYLDLLDSGKMDFFLIVILSISKKER